MLRLAAYQTAPASEQMEKDFLTIGATLAALSSHPGRDEAARVARKQGCPQCPVIGFQDFSGKGFGGAVPLPGDGAPRAAMFGTRAFLAECGLELPDLLIVAARRWQDDGTQLLFGGWDGYVRGILKFEEKA